MINYGREIQLEKEKIIDGEIIQKKILKKNNVKLRIKKEETPREIKIKMAKSRYEETKKEIENTNEFTNKIKEVCVGNGGNCKNKLPQTYKYYFNKGNYCSECLTRISKKL